MGSIRRDCLDHVVVLGEGHLGKILKSYLGYYHRTGTHLGLGKDTPEPRAIQPAHVREIVELPQVEGLHNRYVRQATYPADPVRPAFCRIATLTEARDFLASHAAELRRRSDSF